MVSVYLDYANPKTAPEGWHACAQFCLAISNPSDPTIQTSSRESHGLRASTPFGTGITTDDSADAHHRFVAEECDWGFTRFVDLRKLYTPDTASGKTRPTIENDEVEITAFVRVLKDPTGVLWHNFVK